eukprot:TRINITY_DN6740_c0_g1_i1.p1 TRINITY_DN6740_c0_g1~~TRINITY_DN6740_c0_g1_i1.p1  ORF type:complete len:541 (+),score=91.50 TRINITY_DN6740_c0_g1_i1:23-1645(+)
MEKEREVRFAMLREMFPDVNKSSIDKALGLGDKMNDWDVAVDEIMTIQSLGKSMEEEDKKTKNSPVSIKKEIETKKIECEECKKWKEVIRQRDNALSTLRHNYQKESREKDEIIKALRLQLQQQSNTQTTSNNNSNNTPNRLSNSLPVEVKLKNDQSNDQSTIVHQTLADSYQLQLRVMNYIGSQKKTDIHGVQKRTLITKCSNQIKIMEELLSNPIEPDLKTELNTYLQSLSGSLSSLGHQHSPSSLRLPSSNSSTNSTSNLNSSSSSTSTSTSTSTTSTSTQSPTAPPPEVPCPICLNDFPQSDLHSFGCTDSLHKYCTDCCYSYITAALSDISQFPLYCPGKTCKHPIESSCVETILFLSSAPQSVPLTTAFDLKTKFDRLQILSLNFKGKIITCPHCNEFCEKPDENPNNINNNRVFCPSCRKDFCVKCEVHWHTGVTCEQFREREKTEDAKELEKMAKENGWQECKGCKVYVAKKNGCNHMRCLCRAEFCYLCGEVFDAGHKGSACKEGCKCSSKHGWSSDHPLFSEADVLDGIA